MIYLLNLIAVILYYYLLGIAYGNTQKRKKMFAIMVCIHTVLFRALANPFNYPDNGAYKMCFDWIANQPLYNVVINENYYSGWGRGYIFWNWLLSCISNDSSILYIASACLGVPPVIWFYYKTAPKMLMPIIIFLAYPMMYYHGFYVLRQHLSIAFILLAIYYIDEWKKAIPLALVAAFMHTSGIVIFPFFIWRRINFKQLTTVKLVVLVAVGLVVIRSSMAYVLSLMPKYEAIVQDSVDVSNRLPLIWFSCIALASLYNNTYRKITSRIESIVMSFFYYGLLISIFCVGLSQMGRFTMCFLYATPAASAIIIKYSRDKLLNILVISANVIVTLLQLINAVTSHNYVYTFFWE